MILTSYSIAEQHCMPILLPSDRLLLNEMAKNVEVKSFIGASKIQDLKEALGQYDIYRYLIEETAPERKLYIAIIEVAYKTFFSQDLAQLIITKHQLPVIVVNIDTEEVVQWIN
jgi:hypothetical protein